MLPKSVNEDYLDKKTDCKDSEILQLEDDCNTSSCGKCSNADGCNTSSNGECSHAEGCGSKAMGDCSHAEGLNTRALESNSHSEGCNTRSIGNCSHAEGYSTLTEGYGAHSEGYYTTARAPFSHAEGYYTDTKSNTGAHIMGIYGEADTPYSWFLGGGTSGAKALAAKILYTGDAYIRNAWHAGGTGYSEIYRSICNQIIEPGYFVTLEGECIRTAKDSDKFILGVTSANPGFVTNSSELNLGNSFLTNVWNQTLYEDTLIPERKDEDGNIIEPAQSLKQPMLKSQSAISNHVAVSSSDCTGIVVTLLGQVLVLDDGTCEANNFCWPNKDGVATSSSFGYKVMKRISDNQILIFFRG